jgi:hypothetical protein
MMVRRRGKSINACLIEWNILVKILSEALMAFRREFMELTKPKNGHSLPIDILRDNMTVGDWEAGKIKN